MMEMDSASSPAAKRSARPSFAPRMASAPGIIPVGGQNNVATAAATQSLKDFLKLPSQPSPQQFTSPQQSVAQPYHQQNPFMTTTPQQQSHAGPYDPSLHYGNRNLSPLFQAARSPNAGPPQANNSPLHARTPLKQPQPFDPRAFLDQQARAASSPNHPSFSPAQPQRMPNANYSSPRQFDAGYDVFPASPSSRMQPKPDAPIDYNQSPVQRRHPDSPTESPDVNDMSAKLRGMLKLGF